MIYRCLCTCPNDHIIEGMIAPFSDPVEDEEKVTKNLALFLKTMMELWVLDGKLGDTCEICNTPLTQCKFAVDKQDTAMDEANIKTLWADLTPHLMKQRALRHARKNKN